MKLKWAIVYVGFLFLLVSITGCVYLRLLEVKRQLYDFDSYFEIKEEHGLTLVFLKPVLLTEDVIWLMKLGPASEEETDQGELWIYILEKQYPSPKDEDGDFDIPIVMLFENGKLREVRFPERFLTFMSKPLLTRMFRSMGHAEINKLKRSASSKFEGRDSLEIPRKQFVVRVLGKPFNTEESNHSSKFIYKYNLKRTESGSSSEESELWAKFTFEHGNERLLKAEGNFSRLRISMDFSVEESGDGQKGDSR